MYVCVHLRAAALRQAHLQVATKISLSVTYLAATLQLVT